MNNVTHINPFMSRLVVAGIAPQQDVWMSAAARGLIAVLVFEALGDVTGLRNLGWRGERCFALSRGAAKRLAVASDPVTRRWLLARPSSDKAKLFVFVHHGTFLLNFSTQQGLTVEPGSLDSEQPDGAPYAGAAFHDMLWFPKKT